MQTLHTPLNPNLVNLLSTLPRLLRNDQSIDIGLCDSNSKGIVQFEQVHLKLWFNAFNEALDVMHPDLTRLHDLLRFFLGKQGLPCDSDVHQFVGGECGVEE